MKNILLVEDDINIGNMIEEVLLKEGYLVTRAYSGTEALLQLQRYKPNLILLDLILPGLSGEEVVSNISGIPIIVLSAKTNIDNKINLLLQGVVDYMIKPLNIRELLARISIHLNYLNWYEPSKLYFDDVVLNIDERCISTDNKEIKLTRTELAILKVLVLNDKQIVTKSYLLDNIMEDTPDCTDSSLKMHISNLRKKLRELSGREYIEAIWGVGFKLK